jgi:hypothetical protein
VVVAEREFTSQGFAGVDVTGLVGALDEGSVPSLVRFFFRKPGRVGI